jgi:hypothetical protein
MYDSELVCAAISTVCGIYDRHRSSGGGDPADPNLRWDRRACEGAEVGNIAVAASRIDLRLHWLAFLLEVTG